MYYVIFTSDPHGKLRVQAVGSKADILCISINAKVPVVRKLSDILRNPKP